MIKHPTAEEALEQETQERLEREAYMEMKQRELEAQEKIARYDYLTKPRQSVWLKLPTQLAAIGAIFVLALFKRPIPPVLDSFLT